MDFHFFALQNPTFVQISSFFLNQTQGMLNQIRWLIFHLSRSVERSMLNHFFTSPFATLFLPTISKSVHKKVQTKKTAYVFSVYKHTINRSLKEPLVVNHFFTSYFAALFLAEPTISESVHWKRMTKRKKKNIYEFLVYKHTIKHTKIWYTTISRNTFYAERNL